MIETYSHTSGTGLDRNETCLSRPPGGARPQLGTAEFGPKRKKYPSNTQYIFLYITLFTFSCHIRSVTAVVEQGMDLLRTEHKPIPIMFRMLWIVLNSALALSPVFKQEWKVLFPRLTGPKGYLNGDITLILMRKLKQDRASNEFICK